MNKKPESYTEKIEEYLDDIRDSGEINMYGVGPYLREEFGLTKAESHECLAYWTRTYTARWAAKDAS